MKQFTYSSIISINDYSSILKLNLNHLLAYLSNNIKRINPKTYFIYISKSF